MDIVFKTKKLQKICNNYKLLQKEFGQEQAKKIRLRLDDLRAAECLLDISPFPPSRRHELVGNMKGKFSVDVKHPYRLILEPVTQPPPLKDDGGIDLEQVIVIRILGVEDTHD
ncbi:MAG: killer suppression protein [bacterium]|nr:killer suppression protein [bacterium]